MIILSSIKERPISLASACLRAFLLLLVTHNVCRRSRRQGSDLRQPSLADYPTSEQALCEKQLILCCRLAFIDESLYSIFSATRGNPLHYYMLPSPGPHGRKTSDLMYDDTKITISESQCRKSSYATKRVSPYKKTVMGRSIRRKYAKHIEKSNQLGV